MKILCIPFERVGYPNADIRFAPLIDTLSHGNEIIGVKRAFCFNPNKRLMHYLKFFYYITKTLLFGLKHSNSIDLILCENAYYVSIGSILSVLTHRPCIWDSHGNTLAYCDELRMSKIFTTTLLTIEKIAKKVTKLMVVPSEVDKRLYIEMGFEPEKIRVIPSGIDLSVVDKVSGNKVDIRRELGLDVYKKILIFIGNRKLLPNMEAANWINDELAPAIAERFSDVQILIIGLGEIPSHVHPFVTFTGFVTGLYEYIYASDLCIAPLNLDCGIFTKVIDSMACAKPIVVLPSAADGIPQLVDGENAIIVKDKTEFIAKCLDILEELDDVNKIGINARKVIEEHYNWEVLSEEWHQLVRKIVAESS